MDAEQVVGGVLLGLGLVVAVLNWSAPVLSWRTGRFVSAVTLVGGIFLCLGAALIPPLRPYAWAAPFLDYGTIVVVLALPWLVREAWTTSRFNLLEE